MNVLWYVNIVMPDAAQALGLEIINVAGWLLGAVSAIKTRNIQLTIVATSVKVSTPQQVAVDGITYYVLPRTADFQERMEEILQKVKPDLVHVYGTEYQFNTDLIHICRKKNLKCVISLQGIMFACADHYMDGLPEKFKKANPLLTLAEKVYYVDRISKAQMAFRVQGEREKLALKDATHVIGRTAWDRSTALSVNPNLKYYHVNETLRSEFYTEEIWKYAQCQRHSIFISQASYPIKGLHMLLPCLPELAKRYPDLQVYISGEPPYTHNNKLMDMVGDYLFEYQGYLKKLIRKYKLQDRVHYTGTLPPQKMKEQFLKCNVFVSMSTIENESNSVSEAKMLGVPVVASSVGGVKDRITDGVNGWAYDFYDTDALQQKISEVFQLEANVASVCENARKDAQRINDREANTEALLKVYADILQNQDT